MTDQSRFQLTDAAIERMLVERAGRGAPADLVPAITAAVESTGQRAPGLLGAMSGPAASRTRRGPRRIWLLVAATLLVGTGVVGAALIGGRLVAVVPVPTMPVAVTTPTTVPSPGPSASVVPYRAASWKPTGNMLTPRLVHTATLLNDGTVLVAGGYSGSDPVASAELYDPATGTWKATGNMVTGGDRTATLLPNGKVLVVGGTGGASAELYDPASGTWTPAGNMVTAGGGTATLLQDGKVLVTGSASAELYDPASGTWTPTGNMVTGPGYHTATLLPDGRVLVAGVANGSAELYDPGSGSWTATGDMITLGGAHNATLLNDGTVLVAGGYFGTDPVPVVSAELYDPATGTWKATGNMVTPRWSSATLLDDGRVLVAGGGPSTSAELYDPSTGTWAPTASMGTVREGQTATLLPDGRVLVAGAASENNHAVNSAELYDPGSGTSISATSPSPSASLVPYRAASWTATGSMTTPRMQQAATLLPDGKVLVVGGYHGNFPSSYTTADVYDPNSGTWTVTGRMIEDREAGLTATLLRDGKVLVASGDATFASAELYDPATARWTATGSMTTPRMGHTATLLSDGRVLVAGGEHPLVGDVAGRLVALASAELYDPGTGTWTATGSMTAPRAGHTATLLPNGKVLVVGGTTAELYDPGTETWTATGSMATPRDRHTATLLTDGKVLVAGGYGYGGSGGTLASAELYDPGTGTWAATGSMGTPRVYHTATLLPDGRVLVAGGTSVLRWEGDILLASAELYDSSTGTWTATASMVAPRESYTATLLPDERVLVAGGKGGASGNEWQPTAELFDPGKQGADR